MKFQWSAKNIIVFPLNSAPYANKKHFWFQGDFGSVFLFIYAQFDKIRLDADEVYLWQISSQLIFNNLYIPWPSCQWWPVLKCCPRTGEACSSHRLEAEPPPRPRPGPPSPPLRRPLADPRPLRHFHCLQHHEPHSEWIGHTKHGNKNNLARLFFTSRQRRVKFRAIRIPRCFRTIFACKCAQTNTSHRPPRFVVFSIWIHVTLRAGHSSGLTGGNACKCPERRLQGTFRPKSRLGGRRADETTLAPSTTRVARLFFLLVYMLAFGCVKRALAF